MDELADHTEPPMAFTIAETPDRPAVITIRGELDISNVGDLDAAVAPIIETHPDALIVDVTELSFADSSAIALWVRWATAVGDLRLRGISPLLGRVIETMGLGGKLRAEG